MTGHDRGFATVWVVAMVALVATFGGLAATVAAAVAVRRTAETAADLAALAAAGRAPAGPSVACAAGARVAVANRAQLLRCALTGDVAEVEVAVDGRGPLRALGPATARARAGPVGAAPRGLAAGSVGHPGRGRNLVRAASLPPSERERAPPYVMGVVDADVRRWAATVGADVHAAARRTAAAQGRRAAR